MKVTEFVKAKRMEKRIEKIEADIKLHTARNSKEDRNCPSPDSRCI